MKYKVKCKGYAKVVWGNRNDNAKVMLRFVGEIKSKIQRKGNGLREIERKC